MPLLEWRTEFSIGVLSVDAEHRELIDLINALYEHMDARSSEAEIQGSLGDIYKAIAIHFDHEERMMVASRYTEYESHKAHHESLLEQLNDLMNAFVENPIDGGQRLRNEMSDWFVIHFAEHDARLHSAVSDVHE